MQDMQGWHEEFLGRPWSGRPEPPSSFSCGELIRYVYRRDFGHECLPIPVPDARSLPDCLRAMRPGYFGLVPVPAGQERNRDAVFLSRRRFMDHCGLLVVLPDGSRRVLHCAPRGGVQLASFGELKALGYTSWTFWRAPCSETEAANGKD